jgi:hypothetical protein
MNRDGHKDVRFFVGPEVEHTPAYSKRTLFVVGKQDVAEILNQANSNRTTHIFMGANHSFSVDPTDGTLYWDKTITALLDKGFWVTLDYQAHEHKSVLMMLNAGIWQSRLFVPLLGVRIPKIETSSPNLTVKIDDVDFKATNRGVWCMHFHEVTDSNRFTDWQDYESDTVIDDASLALKQGVSLMSSLENIVEPKTRTVADVITDLPKPTEPLNDTELGLDVVPTTALKPDPDVVSEVVASTVKTPVDAANAYADGATSDPLSAEASKKPKSKK